MNALARHFGLGGLLRFAAPAIGMMLVISIYTVTDGIFIGRYAGSLALAASNIVYPALNLVFGLSIMLASGGSALVAKTMGEGDMALARSRFTMIAAVGAALGVWLALSVFFFMEPLLSLPGASPELYADCRSYLAVNIFFAPCIALMIVFNAFYIADGRPVQGFFVSLTAGMVNAGLDYVFLALFGMGVFGAGLATGLSDLTAAVLGLLYFSRWSRTIFFSRFSFSLRPLFRAAYNGSSEMVTQLSVGITTYLFNLVTFAYAGADGVAAISIILYAEMLLTAVFMGFSNGVAPIFSYRFGARDYGELRRLLRLSLGVLLAFGFLSFAAAHVFAAPLIALFLPDGGHVYTLAHGGFLLFSWSFLLCGFNLFASSFFTALSDGKMSAILSFVRNLAGIVIFLLVLPRFFGLDGAWLAVPAADAAAVVLSFWQLHGAAESFREKKEKARVGVILER